jgi:hypothetical protein
VKQTAINKYSDKVKASASFPTWCYV